jgi:lambda family phage holin
MMINDQFNIPPEVAGLIMAVLTAVLRVLYDRKKTRPFRVVLEALICGALSLTASSGIIAAGLDPKWSVFAGGMIGYLGSTTVRALAIKIIKARGSKQ